MMEGFFAVTAIHFAKAGGIALHLLGMLWLVQVWQKLSLAPSPEEKSFRIGCQVLL
jgi:hypothetical protein